MADDLTRLLIDHHSAAGPKVTQVRGSLVVSSLQTLRELGHYARYLELLKPEQRETVLGTLAMSWVSIETAMAHYEACDAMRLSHTEHERMVQFVAKRFVGTVFGTLMRAAQQAGVTPMLPLEQFDRLWDRVFVGGSCRVRRTGPKDVVIDARGVPLFRYRYFRVGFFGMTQSALLMFARAMHGRIVQAAGDNVTLGLSWV